jgi:hypothetical protein
MLSRIGYISPPVELVGTLYFGEVLTSVEQVLAGGVPQVAIEPLDRVPRLEPMMRSLAALAWTDEQNAGLGDVKAGLGSGLLGCPSLYDALTAQGHPTLRGSSRLRGGSSLRHDFCGRHAPVHAMPLSMEPLGFTPATGVSDASPFDGVAGGLLRLPVACSRARAFTGVVETGGLGEPHLAFREDLVCEGRPRAILV